MTTPSDAEKIAKAVKQLRAYFSEALTEDEPYRRSRLLEAGICTALMALEP